MFGFIYEINKHDRLGDSRLSRMLQLALCQELDAVTASRQYCIVFIGYQYDDESLSSPL